MDKQNTLLQFLKERAKDDTISFAHLQEGSEQFDHSLRDLEAFALKHSILPIRFQRNGFSCSEQLQLSQATVAIIGCGGLGGRSAELLARIGIGTLILTDHDIFSESNLNRQIFCTLETLGCKKTEVVARELQKINPTLQTIVHNNSFNSASIKGAEIVIDALDTPEARRSLAELCHKNDVPMIHGAVKEWYGQVGIEQLNNALISTLYPKTAHSVTPPKVKPMAVALIAALQASETCKLILKKESPLHSAWLQCDLLDCEFITFSK